MNSFKIGDTELTENDDSEWDWALYPPGFISMMCRIRAAIS